MTTTRLLLVLSILLGACVEAVPASGGEPNEHLAPLAPFVGKTWRGEFSTSTEENPVVDVQKWEWAIGGQAIRILHSINDGEYGGETMVLWDRERERLIYFYFTTAGFYTTGTLAERDGAFVSYEEVTGAQDGTTAVRATSVIRDDGTLFTTSEYLRGGEWVPGHEITYVEDPDAEVIFR